jgi:hypothetical protein
MTSNSSPLDSFARGATRVLGGLFGLLLALFGFLLMLWMLALGIAAAIGFTLWSLLRGRRPPPMAFRWRSTRHGGAAHRGPPSAAPKSGEVVDVQVREIESSSDDRV